MNVEWRIQNGELNCRVLISLFAIEDPGAPGFAIRY